MAEECRSSGEVEQCRYEHRDLEFRHKGKRISEPEGEECMKTVTPPNISLVNAAAGNELDTITMKIISLEVIFPEVNHHFA